MAQTDNSGAKEQSAPLVGAKERFDRIYNTIRDQICLLEYAPGTRLSEEELAKQFDTSRTPVRRVLARLEAEGLVASVHGVGTIVTDPDLDEVFQIYRLRLELAELVGVEAARVVLPGRRVGDGPSEHHGLREGVPLR